MKILTVSIAAYNVEAFLSKALDSLTKQETIDCIEVIIENDGSTDNTKQIAENYMKEYPSSIILNNKENGGYGSTINESIKMAKGKYFKQLDGDDWFFTENLKSFLDFLSKCDADIVLTPFMKCYNNKSFVVENNNSIGNKVEKIEKIRNLENIAMHELCIKTNILRENGVRITEKCFYTDYEFVVYSLLAAKTICKYQHAIYCYRLDVEGQSVSISGERKHYKDREKIIRRFAKEYESMEFNNATIKSFIDMKMTCFFGDCYKSFSLLENIEEGRRELCNLDEWVKNDCQLVYTITNKKYVVLIRKTLTHKRLFLVLMKLINFLEYRR